MWYVANVLFKSCHEPNLSEVSALWEEAFLLVEATSVEGAEEKALSIAVANEVSYKGVAGEAIHWRVERVLRVVPCEDLSDGAEIFSRHLRNEEAISLMRPFEE